MTQSGSKVKQCRGVGTEAENPVTLKPCSSKSTDVILSFRHLAVMDESGRNVRWSHTRASGIEDGLIWYLEVGRCDFKLLHGQG